MKLGHWIALAIVILAIIVLIFAIFHVAKKMFLPLKGVMRFQEDIEKRIDFYQKEFQPLQEQLDSQSEKSKTITEQLEFAAEQLECFQEEYVELNQQIHQLNEMKEDVALACVEKSRTYIQEEVPKKAKKWKAIFQKTYQKQKTRYSK